MTSDQAFHAKPKQQAGGVVPFAPRPQARVAWEAPALDPKQWARVLWRTRTVWSGARGTLGPEPHTEGCFAPEKPVKAIVYRGAIS
jgi:hypothetical protein